jgi:hypothetical protein
MHPRRRIAAISVLCLFFVVCAELLSATAAAQTAAGLHWTPPAGWKSAPDQPMRAATYMLAPASGDMAAAECALYFFGAGQGGSVDDNIARWKSQVLGADGKPATAKIAARTINGLHVTTIDASGQYTGMGGPMSAGRPVPGYRLLGAVVEGPSGNVFIKLTGPVKTVSANEQKFEQLLASFKRS